MACPISVAQIWWNIQHYALRLLQRGRPKHGWELLLSKQLLNWNVKKHTVSKKHILCRDHFDFFIWSIIFRSAVFNCGCSPRYMQSHQAKSPSRHPVWTTTYCLPLRSSQLPRRCSRPWQTVGSDTVWWKPGHSSLEVYLNVKFR